MSVLTNPPSYKSEYSSAIKKDEIMLFVEWGPREHDFKYNKPDLDKYHVFSHM
jgi:hypothetical protein